jgi:hypothetical protein
MKRFFAAATIAIIGILMAGATYAGDKASADHVICKMTHPWPWGCGHEGYAMGDDADRDGVSDQKDKCPGAARRYCGRQRLSVRRRR